MSTLHSPLGIIIPRSLSSIILSHDHRNNQQSHSRTKSQSPKQKGYAFPLPLSPAPFHPKRRDTLPAYEHKRSFAGNQAGDGNDEKEKKGGGGNIGTKGPEAKTHHRTLLMHTQNEGVESSFSEFDDWDGNGSDSISGLCEPQPLCTSFPS